MLTTQQFSPENSSPDKLNNPFSFEKLQTGMKASRRLLTVPVYSRTIMNSCRYENLQVNRRVFVPARKTPCKQALSVVVLLVRWQRHDAFLSLSIYKKLKIKMQS